MLKTCLKNWFGLLKRVFEEGFAIFFVFFVLGSLIPAPLALCLRINDRRVAVLIFVTSFFYAVIFTLILVDDIPANEVFLTPFSIIKFNGKRIPWAVLYLVLLRHRKEVEILSLTWLFKDK